jgi:hypothetical protein
MHWNYRVLHEQLDNLVESFIDESFKIIECYYEDDGSLAGYCDASALGETLEELRADIDRFKKATEQPILTPEDFKQQGEQHEPEA